MKCVAVAVVSQDGFLTKGDDPDVTSWTSPEEKAHFDALRKKYNLYVFGSRTFDAVQPTALPGKLKIVLTHHPDRYKDKGVKGQLEFHNLSASGFVKKYETKFDSCLVLGGTNVYSDFIESGLLSELILVVEPVTHSRGRRLLNDPYALIKAGFREISNEQLNLSGTTLRHYRR